MRVVVTGGAGFIGSNLVFALIGAGHQVFVVDDLSTGSIGNLHPAADFRRLDILDEQLAPALGDFHPDAIVHLAAQSSVAVSIQDPEHDRAVNVDGTRAVAQAACDADVSRVVFASSAAVYGDPADLPVTEGARKQPSNPYGVSKLAAESVLDEVLRPAGVDFAALRFSNVYGPRQDWRGEGGVVAVFASAMLFGGVPVVFGDGLQTRDFIYVGDVVLAILAALAHEGALAGVGPDGPAYNISTGRETSVKMLAERMAALAEYRGPIEHTEPRAGDVLRSVLDPRKAETALKWDPNVSLDSGVRHVLAWMARNP